ncbi:tetratricopeptide repeat protein [Singulisphaera sp. PoT]|uniref:tetratricopeptide repeat protein n=1 Tax=Singulisphaera sp. PoT TaxID=3411797 RepID=UPI003BF474E1
MTNALQRGLILLEQGRYDLAEREFRGAIIEAPDEPGPHAMLALCLKQRDLFQEALHEADEAIRLEPGWDFGHYVRGRVLLGMRRLKEAEASLHAAIQLDPNHIPSFGLLAQVYYASNRWQKALEAADHGLSLDAENALCANVRAMALIQLGRKQEAAETLGSALEDDPENALTQANQGWTCLHRGDHVQALVHFREALRLEPNLEWAREGIVEALKARHLIYRLMLRFFLWTGRQSSAARWGLILGIIFGRRLLAEIGRARPELQFLITPILCLLFAFITLTWIASPLFNFFLMFNRFGRLALSREQKTEASWIGISFLFAFFCLLSFFVYPLAYNLAGMIYFGLLLFPLSVTFGRSNPTHQRLLGVYTGVLALLGLPFLSLGFLGSFSPWRNGEKAGEYLVYFFFGAILSSWVPALLGLRSSRD